MELILLKGPSPHQGGTSRATTGTVWEWFSKPGSGSGGGGVSQFQGIKSYPNPELTGETYREKTLFPLPN